ncbi:MAG TPA: prolyl oligopeptidase family serine peptidase [Puia sp.]|nr:prolyl oligopeptidase family serine peptidase [Puia sp.]
MDEPGAQRSLGRKYERLMKFLFILLFGFGTSNFLLAQKKPLDYAASKNWPYLSAEAISNNGKFITYKLDTGGGNSCMVVTALGREWKRTFANVSACSFTVDSRRLIFRNNHDSLYVLNLDDDNIKCFDSVKSFQLAPGNDGWLGFMRGDSDCSLYLYNLQTGRKRRFSGVEMYVFNDQGNALLLKIKNSSSNNLKSLIWVNFDPDTLLTVSDNFTGNVFSFNKKGDELAFLVTDSIGKEPSLTLKLYKLGMDSAITVVNSSASGMEGWTIQDGDITFGKTDDEIYFPIQKVDTTKSNFFNDHNRKIRINNYKAEGLDNIFGKEGEAAIHLTEKGHIIVIRHDKDTRAVSLIVDVEDSYALVTTLPDPHPNLTLPSEWQRSDLYLVSIRDGSRKLLKRNGILDGIGFSPTGKYITWYDQESCEWNIYDFKDNHKVIIGKAISEPLYKIGDIWSDRIISNTGAEGIIGWFKNDSNVLINGRFDIWEVDPEGRGEPINLTKRLGISQRIRFRVVDFGPDRFLKDTLLLSAFDVLTKESGFFQLVLGKSNSLVKLSMVKFIYSYPNRNDSDIGGGAPDIIDHPLKAKNSNTYLVQRMSTREYPNLFVTSDFRTYKALTHLEPEKKYNWYSTELIRFSLPNGRKSEGILFKPENFDPHRKYPVIFYYYEKNADLLNIYLNATLSDGCLNIPWFVSNGYLVFVPDIIYYQQGSTGECAYENVNAAADALVRFPWVNGKALGLQGHSFGGWETNYIITQTARFKAAASASGYADEVSFYGQFSIVAYNYYFISGQARLGTSLWQNPGVYIRNSPIYWANKVRTPLLLMHTVKDTRVKLSQALEFYRALASLQKKVWLLQYPNEDHLLDDEYNRLDYSMRLAQFFNYYLKGAYPAKWMTQDVHLNDMGLDLDTSGSKP